MSIHLNPQADYFARTYQLGSLISAGKVLVLYGPRQVGKTSLIQDFIKTSPLKTFFGTGDDNRLQALFAEPDFDNIIDFAKNYELLVIDEAQNIPNIGQGLKIIVDHIPAIKVIVTGSASFELAGQVGEPLVGRKWTRTLFPLSVLELQKYFTNYELTEEVLEKFLLFGMYPEVLTAKTNASKREAITEIADSYLLKDILTLEKVKSSNVLRKLLQLLAWQVGSEVSLRELSNSLDINYKTVARYLDLLEKAFVIVGLHGFSRNLRKEITKKNKYYFVDIGIRNALIDNFNPLDTRNDIGQIWENFLFMERLKKQEYTRIHTKNYFWRTWEQKEVDLVEERDGKLYGYEFKWSTKKTPKPPKDWLETYDNASHEVINKENFLSFVGN